MIITCDTQEELDAILTDYKAQGWHILRIIRRSDGQYIAQLGRD